MEGSCLSWMKPGRMKQQDSVTVRNAVEVSSAPPLLSETAGEVPALPPHQTVPALLLTSWGWAVPLSGKTAVGNVGEAELLVCWGVTGMSAVMQSCREGHCASGSAWNTLTSWIQWRFSGTFFSFVPFLNRRNLILTSASNSWLKPLLWQLINRCSCFIKVL